MEIIRGLWEDCNTFITDSGDIKPVVPKDYIWETYKGKFPLNCFIHLQGFEIMGVVPIKDKTTAGSKAVSYVWGEDIDLANFERS